MSEEVSHLSMTGVADWAEVRLSAVSNWRKRHFDFPSPHVVSGQEVFEVREVAQWLRGRTIPRNLLKSDETPGTSYGDRFLRNIDTSGSPTATVASAEAQPRKSAWVEQLWAGADRLRGVLDISSSLEFLLALVYVRTQRTDVWKSLIGASGWTEMRDLLLGVSLPIGPGALSVPVFRAVARTADPSLFEAVRLIGKIDFGRGDSPESTGAQMAEAILANLERGMGRSGGHFTPPDIARCLVELLDPQLSDRVYDPFCGSGELLSAAAAHVGRQSGSIGGWQVCGQTPHEWSWVTSTMNLALHGVEADLGTPGNALQEDRFPERRFSRILANPPFNLRMEPPRDRVWPFGEPPAHNANFAWLQHVMTKLEPGGQAAVIMPGGAAFRGGREMSIRKGMVEAGVVECVIALPSHLFRFTAVPTMVWILCDVDATSAVRQTLFIDARHLGEMADRTHRRLGADGIGRIVSEYRTWRDCRAGQFAGADGFSRAVGYDEISQNGYVLTPGRYTGLPGERLDTVRVSAELGTLRDELEDLRRRAEEARGALDVRLADFIAGQRPGGDGQSVPLGAVCDVLSGPGTVSRSGRQPSWTPLVLPRNIKNGRIGYEDLDVVPPATAERMARYRLTAGDIVSVRAGTLGRYGRVLEEQTGWLLGPGCVRFRPDEQANPDYLTYYLGSPPARHWLMEHATGSAIQHVNAATFREMPLWLLPLPVQHAIVEILNAFTAAASIHSSISATTKDLHDLLIPMLMSPVTTHEVR